MILGMTEDETDNLMGQFLNLIDHVCLNPKIYLDVENINIEQIIGTFM